MLLLFNLLHYIGIRIIIISIIIETFLVDNENCGLCVFKFHLLVPLGEKLPRTIYEAWLWFSLDDPLLYLLNNILLQLYHSAALPILEVNYLGHLAPEPMFGVPNIFLLRDVQIVRASLLHSH